MRIGDFRVFRQWFSIARLSGEMGDALCVFVAVQFTELCDRRKLEDDLALEVSQFFRRENQHTLINKKRAVGLWKWGEIFRAQAN